jgi:hypothetical protein
MTRATTGIEDAPLTEYWLGITLLNVLDYLRRQAVEMPRA